jgi:hypothetical protein
MDFVVPEGWAVLSQEEISYSFSESRSFSAELVPQAIRDIAQPGLTYRNPETGALLQKQKNGKWKKIGTERSPLEILKGGVKGRVPKDDPSEPLSSGSTPLEKVKQKMAKLNKNLSDTDRLSTDEELERYGKMKLVSDEMENTKEGKFKLPFGKGKDDLDSSKTRAQGKVLRKIFPNIEDRQSLSKAIFLGRQSLVNPDPLLRKKKFDTKDIMSIEKKNQELSTLIETTKEFLNNNQVKKNLSIKRSIENWLGLLNKYQKRYASAIDRSSNIRV